VVNGSLDLAARDSRFQAFLIDLVSMSATTEVAVQWLMNRTRGARVLKRFMAEEYYDCFVLPAALYHLNPSLGALLAIKLSRKLCVHVVAFCS